MALRSYNPNDAMIYFAGNLLDRGLVSIKISPVDRTFTTIKGIDGESVRVLNNNRNHLCTLVVMGTSPVNDTLSSIWSQGRSGLNGGGIGTFSLVNVFGTDEVSAAKAYIENPPDIEYAGEPGERTWEIMLIDPSIVHGSLPAV